MVACLRENALYSEKRARDFLFDALEAIILTRSPAPTLSRLAREAATEARRAAQPIGYEFSNWDPAARAVVNAMLQAGVLLGPGAAPLRPGLEAHATQVVSLQNSHRDRTEAFLIEFLIAKLGDMSIHDHKALAHALFRQFDACISVESLEDRVVALLATMVDRVRLLENSVYAVRSDRHPALL